MSKKLYVLMNVDIDDRYVYLTEVLPPDLFERPTNWAETIEDAKTFTEEQKAAVTDIPRGLHNQPGEWLELPGERRE